MVSSWPFLLVHFTYNDNNKQRKLETIEQDLFNSQNRLETSTTVYRHDNGAKTHNTKMERKLIPPDYR